MMNLISDNPPLGTMNLISENPPLGTVDLTPDNQPLCTVDLISEITIQHMVYPNLIKIRSSHLLLIFYRCSVVAAYTDRK